LETSLLKYQLSDDHSGIIFLVIIIYFKIDSTKIYIGSHTNKKTGM